MPDFLGRGPVGSGTGDASGATAHALGVKYGKETHLLASAESGVPAHTHPFGRGAAAGGGSSAWASSTFDFAVDISANTAAAAASAHENRGPETTVNFFIKT